MPTQRLTHITETYRGDEDSRLTRVEAYYRNDTHTGVGVIIEGENLSLFDDMMRDYEDAWAGADANQRRDIVRAYVRQLETLGTTRVQDRSDRDNYLCAQSIAFLEKYGYVQGDPYNGCQFVYDVDPDHLDDFL